MTAGDLPEGQQSKEVALLAAAIRAAVPDEEACVADEDACFDQHPIHLMSSVNGVVDMVFARVDGAAKVVVDALDLPARDARVRAQAFADALELIAQHAIGVSPEPWLADAMDQERIPFGKVREALAEAAETPAAPAEIVVAALPDVVGTPEPGCPNCRRYGVPARVEHCGPGCHEAHTYVPPCEMARHIADEAGTPDHPEARDAD